MAIKNLIQNNRVKFGYIYGLMTIILSKPHKISRFVFFIGAILMLLGEFIRFYASGFLKKGIELAKTGPYALVRNPLYVGSFIIGLGVAILSYSLSTFIVFIIFFVVFYPAKIVFEEKELKENFGQEFEDYMQETPKLIPILKDITRNCKEYCFDLAIVRNKEYKGVITTILVLIFMYYKRKLLKNK